MATILDVTILNYFSPILLFLLVFVTVYALLNKIKFLGDNKGINAIVALVASLLFLLSGPARVILEFVLPWYLMMGGLIIIILIILGIFGISPKPEDLTKNSALITWIIIVSALILVIGLAKGLGQGALEQGQSLGTNQTSQDKINVHEGSTATDSFGENIYRTIFHPKVLGVIVMILIALFTILFLTVVPK